MKIIKTVLKKLKESGYKLTPQRLSIVNIIFQKRGHMSAQEIIREARKENPKISTSTVYYTLNILKKERLLKEIEFYDKPNKYDSFLDEHINLICLKCNRIEDLDLKVPISYDMVAKKSGFKPIDSRLEYYGYCKSCKEFLF